MKRWRQRIDHGDVIESPRGEFVLYDDHEREMNGLLVENANLRGVRDQLLANHQQYADWVSPQLERLGREMVENDRLRAALTRIRARAREYQGGSVLVTELLGMAIHALEPEPQSEPHT